MRYYVVEENFTKTIDENPRFVSYDIVGGFDDFIEAAKLVEKVYAEKNRRGHWKIQAGGSDGVPIYSIYNPDDPAYLTRMYVKEGKTLKFWKD